MVYGDGFKKLMIQLGRRNERTIYSLRRRESREYNTTTSWVKCRCEGQKYIVEHLPLL